MEGTPQPVLTTGPGGIALLTFLQAPEQAEEVWGANGAGLLWSATNHRIYVGGVAKRKWLADLSELIGTYDTPTLTTTDSRGGRSTNHGTHREPVLSVADLAALRKGPRGPALDGRAGGPRHVGHLAGRPPRSSPHQSRHRHQRARERRRTRGRGSPGPATTRVTVGRDTPSGTARRWIMPARDGSDR